MPQPTGRNSGRTNGRPNGCPIHDAEVRLGLCVSRVFTWLRGCARSVEKEDRDFLVRLHTSVDATVNAVGRLIPIHLAGHNFEALLLTITVFDDQGIATQHDRNAVIGVTVPG